MFPMSDSMWTRNVKMAMEKSHILCRHEKKSTLFANSWTIEGVEGTYSYPSVNHQQINVKFFSL